MWCLLLWQLDGALQDQLLVFYFEDFHDTIFGH